jgi:predicted nucleotidyltransferase
MLESSSVLNIINEITQRLVQEFQPEQVILFGSHAWGTPDRDSDIDLLVIVPHSNQSHYERAVRGLSCLGGIHIPKDIIVKTKEEFDFFRTVRASLEYQIAKQGKVLYERSKASTHRKLAYQSPQ